MKNIIRQGDVCLVPVSKLPEGCKEIPPTSRGIVLALGEVTGHAHAIADWQMAGKLAKGMLASSRIRARLLLAPNGSRFLEVKAPVHLRHEEHTAHKIPAGYYALPIQCEHTADKVRRVAD